LNYRVVLTPAAQRQLGKLRGANLAALRGVILALSVQPCPDGAAKLTSKRNLWRFRLRIDGRAWRVSYQIDDAERLVVITRVVRRDEGTYRGM
jgi:mRNA-degrading endonuclease RelE of RelBE toxin-antitoxin system